MHKLLTANQTLRFVGLIVFSVLVPGLTVIAEAGGISSYSQEAQVAPNATTGGTQGALNAQRVNVHLGIFIYDIANFDPGKGTFEVQGLMHYKWEETAANQTISQELAKGLPFMPTNGTWEILEQDGQPTDTGGPPVVDDFGNEIRPVMRRRSVAFRGVFTTKIDLSDYPKDIQTLKIELEPRLHDAEKLLIIPHNEDATHQAEADSASESPSRAPVSSGLPINLSAADSLHAWSLTGAEGITQKSWIKTYDYDFGANRTDWNQYAPVYTLEIKLQRNVTSYLLKILLPLSVIMLMCFTVFFINPKEFSPQVSICVVSLLACISFHITQGSATLDVGYLMTSDKFFLICYALVLLALSEVVVANWLYHHERVKAALRTDRIASIVFPCVYFLAIGLLLLF